MMKLLKNFFNVTGVPENEDETTIHAVVGSDVPPLCHIMNMIAYQLIKAFQ